MANTYYFFTNATTGGTAVWPIDTTPNDWGIGFPPTNSPVLIRATVSGTGAVAATYTIYHGSLMNDVVVYDVASVASIVLNGTTLDTGSTLFASNPNKYWQVVLSGLSGTGAQTTCVAEY